MSTFVPKKEHLREVLLFAYHWRKSASEAHQMLKEAYPEHSLSEKTCRDWFQRFKAGDYDLCNKERGRPMQKVSDEELQALLDEDPCQTQKQLAEALQISQTTVSRRLQAMGMIQKEGKWLPEELRF